jgi:large subunit ribosomal protein L31e
MAKSREIKVIERTYNVPLRKEFRKVPRYKKSKKAVTALKQFLVKHMKSDNVKVGKSINEEIWKHGIKNPPHHVKVTVTKDDKGEVKAELFGMKKKEDKKGKNAKKKIKTEAPKVEKKAEVKEETKVEEKKEVKEETTETKEAEIPKEEVKAEEPKIE